MRSLSVLAIVLVMLCEFGWLKAQEIQSGPIESKPQKPAEGRVADSVSARPGQGVTLLNGQSGSVTIDGSNGVLVPPSSNGKITITSDATPSNTPGTLVARDASGGFEATNLTLLGNLNLRRTGVVTLNGLLFLHSSGHDNTFLGFGAGNPALTGGRNSGVGVAAMLYTTTGSENSAFGFAALYANSTGSGNSAFGGGALQLNTSGDANSAFGRLALASNTSGDSNAVFGDSALGNNTTGDRNSAFGSRTMTFQRTGNQNSAFGYGALGPLASGDNNSAIGSGALGSLIQGNLNVALGGSAGQNLIHGSGDIYVGSPGADESDTIRIGDTQRATYIAGISGQPVSGGAAVFVDQRGQLGTMPSSARYKEDITNLQDESDVLLRLRPVSFFYKAELDRAHLRQYGLIAEEVAEVAPGLVLRDSAGRPESVRYPAVNAMLLKEVQKQRELLDQQQQEMNRQSMEIEELRVLVERLASRASKLRKD